MGAPRSVQAEEDAPAGRWAARPGLAGVIRVVALVTPLAATLAAVVVASRVVPRPDGGTAVVVWWLALTMFSTAVLVGTDRVARRLLPLSVLLRLSLVFPDRAPSRFRVAWRSGSTRNLARWLAAARAEGRRDNTTKAAETILTLAAALNAHDRKTRGHSEQVRAFTDLLATEMKLPAADTERLRWAGLLHDIGKLAVVPDVLNKPAAPDEDEWVVLKRHPHEGERLAMPLLPWLDDFADTIVQHHERYDGTGYPAGLAGDDICIGARIVSVADCFDTMVTPRPYSRPLTAVAAREELARCAGTQFDPQVVRAFLNVSLGRLRWIIGPAAWVAQIPVASRAAAWPGHGRGALVAKATTAAAAALVAGVVLPLASRDVPAAEATVPPPAQMLPSVGAVAASPRTRPPSLPDADALHAARSAVPSYVLGEQLIAGVVTPTRTTATSTPSTTTTTPTTT